MLLCPALASAGPRVLFLGDSITQAGGWTVEVEAALRADPKFRAAEIVNMGLGSETVSGLSEPGHAGGSFPRPCLHERLGRILALYRPTHIIACYGMNDGIYLPLDVARMKAYSEGMEKLATAATEAGATLVLATPPPFRIDNADTDKHGYDSVLDAQAEWLIAQRKRGWKVADMRAPLKSAIATRKKNEPRFVFAGDGVHPGSEGHSLMAHAALVDLLPLLEVKASTPPPPKALDILRRRSDLLKFAWLSHTKHQRPGVPVGLPLDEAEKQATSLLADYFTALSGD
ncbi:MAG: GDSL-type esterase/lipase family protein [Verrucomicrobiales bacterium]